MERKVIKLQTDEPVVVVLDKGPLGQQVDGKFGLQYQYTVNQDSGVMWISPQAREAIVRSGARAGDHVRIHKTMHGRASSYEIQIVTPGQPRRLEPAAEPPALAPQPIRTNGHTNGNGAPAARALEQEAAEHVAATAVAPRPEVHPLEELLERCLFVAARANVKAYRKLVAEGYLEMADTPNWGDSRSTAISLFIHLSQNGKVRS